MLFVEWERNWNRSYSFGANFMLHAIVTAQNNATSCQQLQSASLRTEVAAGSCLFSSPLMVPAPLFKFWITSSFPVPMLLVVKQRRILSPYQRSGVNIKVSMVMVSIMISFIARTAQQMAKLGRL